MKPPTAYMLRPLRPWTPPAIRTGRAPRQAIGPGETFPAGTRVHFARHPAAGLVVRPVGSRRAFWVEDGDVSLRPPGAPVTPRVEAPEAKPVRVNAARWVKVLGWSVVALAYGALGLVLMGGV